MLKKRKTSGIKSKSAKRGFSLVELIAAISIIAILTAFLVPSVINYVEDSRSKKDNYNMNMIRKAVEVALSNKDVDDEVFYYVTNYAHSGYDILDSKEASPFTGKMMGVTITFAADKRGSSKTTVKVGDGVVNKNVDSSQPDFVGRQSAINVKVKDLTISDEGGYLYTAIKKAVGETIKLTSQTYRNSEYTIFIEYDSFSKDFKVYGAWNGTYLPANRADDTTVTPPPTPECEHSYTGTITTPATCTSTGIKTYTCSKCGDVHIEEVPTIEHNYEWVIDIPSTETEVGIKHEECANCGNKRNENTVIDKLTCTHSGMTGTAAKAATCTEAGNSAYWYCSNCNKYFSDSNGQNEIAANSWIIAIRDHTYGDPTTSNGYATYTCCNCSYSYGAITITEGNRADVGYTNTTTNLTIPATIEKNGVIYNVVAIGDRAFYNCTSLKSVTIPDSVTSIGAGAFIGCTSLTNIVIPNSVTAIGNYAFQSCAFTNITVPGGVTHIADGAFSYCPYLESVILLDGITSVSARAFEYCTSLESIVIPNGVTSIGNYAFERCSALTNITIPNSIVSIGVGTFIGCKSLTNIVIPNSVTAIGDYAFQGCAFTSITLPGSITIIKAGTFSYCSSLTSVIISNGITSIGNESFIGCTSLTNIVIPNSVTSIGSSAFSGCASIASISFNGTQSQWNAIPKGLGWNYNTGCCPVHCSDGDISTHVYSSTTSNGYTTYICSNCSHSYGTVVITDGNRADFGYTNTITSLTIPATITKDGVIYSVLAIDERAFYNCTSLTSITIPNSVTSIGAGAFIGCKSLTNIVIPNSVTAIGDYAFQSCAFTSITLPGSITTINEGVFSYCDKLTSINIPNGVTSINSYAFTYCTALESATIPNSVTTICRGAFEASAIRNITIPSSVKTIELFAFMNCASLESITLSNGVTTIGDYAFKKCASLKNVMLPASVTSLGIGIWESSSSFTSIEVDANNNSYCDVDGVLFNKDKTKLIQYPSGKTNSSYNIPNTVASIESRAFCGATHLTSITIPNSVASIGSGAFKYCGFTSVTLPNGITAIDNMVFDSCASLTNIIIPGNVTSIGEYTFRDCAALTDITFNGTKAQWSVITKGTDWNNNTGNYTVHCSDGDIAKS